MLLPPPPQDTAKLIASSVYSIDRTNTVISRVQPQTGITTFESNLQNDPRCLRMVTSSGGTATGNLATGMKVNLLNAGIKSDSLTIAVYGDVDKNAKVNIQDVLKILQYVTAGNSAAFSAAQLAAGDVNNDTFVNVDDVLRILKYVVNPSIPF